MPSKKAPPQFQKYQKAASPKAGPSIAAGLPASMKLPSPQSMPARPQPKGPAMKPVMAKKAGRGR